MHVRRLKVPSPSLALAMLAVSGVAAQATCSKADFAAVVDQSGQVIQTLNDANKAPFQDKLRQLKTKNQWSDQQFLTEARPFVADERITAFDEEASGLVQQISSMGDTSGATAPDCTTLEGLKGNLDKLVGVIKAKWVYMTEKIDAALK